MYFQVATTPTFPKWEHNKQTKYRKIRKNKIIYGFITARRQNVLKIMKKYIHCVYGPSLKG